MNSIQKTARLAGLIYLMMTPLGILGIMYVPSALIVSGDAIATIHNIVANEMLFRFSIVSALLVQVSQIFVVLLLYKVLKPVNQSLAILMVVLILVAIPIAMLNEINNVAALLLARGSTYLPGIPMDQTQILVPLFLNMHKQGINIASMFWGLWLIPMGYLVIKSGFLPKILGIFLLITGVGYLLDFFIFFLLPDSGVTISAFTGFFEILFPLWLLIRGVNMSDWEKRALREA
jgi:hypothetical protein